MRAAKAAEILSVQESDLTVQILGKLPPEKVSKIFNLMEKEVSARLQKQFMSMKKWYGAQLCARVLNLPKVLEVFNKNEFKRPFNFP